EKWRLLSSEIRSRSSVQSSENSFGRQGEENETSVVELLLSRSFFDKRLSFKPRQLRRYRNYFFQCRLVHESPGTFQIIRKSNLEALRQMHVEMAAEIKNIDTDLQVLVYENYNKFISTTAAVKRKIFDVVATVVCSIKLSGLLKFVHKHCFLYWNFDFNRM
ncbi:hypothetical protein Goshw_021055, partial [Gossypium schwendimanii]|nr:hypothetical protein [Gossypium schwendimanii]